MNAYQKLKETLEDILPEGWKLTPWEPLEDLPDVTGVTMKIRSVQRLQAAPIGHYQVDWVLTITSPTVSREGADPQLFDDLIDFLLALDSVGPWLGWTEATKTVGDDLERLAYDITVRHTTNPEGA